MAENENKENSRTHKKKEKNEDRISWRFQDKSYNDMFKRWRKQSKNTLGFYYENNPNELAYRDGYGFVKAYPETAETNSVRRVYNIIGISLILLSVVDILFKYVLPYLLSKLGVDIYYDYFGGTIYGNEWIIVLLNFIMAVLKRLFPLIYCYSIVNMPVNVMFPMKVTNKPLFNTAVPVAFMVSGVAAAASGVYDVILGVLHINIVETMYFPKETGPLILLLVVEIIVVPFMSEICARGVMLQLVRQFGDGFAIVSMAIVSSLISYNLFMFCYTFIVTTVIGYYTVRTDSVKTAIIMRICSVGFAYLLAAAERYLPQEIEGVVFMALMFAAVMIGLISLMTFIMKHGEKMSMPVSSRYLSTKKKCYIAITNTYIIVWVTLVILLMLMNVRIT